MTNKIYLVKLGNDVRLIAAPNKQRAINHVSRSLISAHLATSYELVELVGNGAVVEEVRD